MRTASRVETKAPSGVEQGTRPGMFLVVAGSGDRAVIRLEGNKEFPDTALQAIEGLVDDILAAEEG